MENKIIKYFISFILAVVLFVAEVLLIVQFNISRGITKNDINNIIDSIDIENEMVELEEYKKEINSEIFQEIIESKELQDYIKENMKVAYNNILYNENNNYIDSNDLKIFVNNILLEKQELIGITEEEIENINKKINDITHEIEIQIEDMETHKSDLKIISSFVSKKTTNYIIIFALLIIGTIILINQSKEGYIFVGIPTLIVGIVFLILSLTLSKTINTTGIDEEVIRYVNTYLPTLMKTLRKSSIITTVIGALSCTAYTILHYQEVESNGKIWFI